MERHEALGQFRTWREEYARWPYPAQCSLKGKANKQSPPHTELFSFQAIYLPQHSPEKTHRTQIHSVQRTSSSLSVKVNRTLSHYLTRPILQVRNLRFGHIEQLFLCPTAKPAIQQLGERPALLTAASNLFLMISVSLKLTK